METITYKGYEGTVEVDMSRMICRGKILFITDLITYESGSLEGIKKEFKAAVDDYFATCKLLNRDPKKPLKGQFNVRVSPELHKKAVSRATRDGVSLNEIVIRSLDFFLNAETEINHNIKVTVDWNEKSMQTMMVNTGTKPQWGSISNAQH